MHTAAATFPHVGVGHGVPTHDSKSVVVNHGGSLKTICNALGVTLIGNEEETILHLFKGRPDEPEVLVVRFVTLDELSERDIPVSGFAFASIC